MRVPFGLHTGIVQPSFAQRTDPFVFAVYQMTCVLLCGVYVYMCVWCMYTCVCGVYVYMCVWCMYTCVCGVYVYMCV